MNDLSTPLAQDAPLDNPHRWTGQGEGDTSQEPGKPISMARRAWNFAGLVGLVICVLYAVQWFLVRFGGLH